MKNMLDNLTPTRFRAVLLISMALLLTLGTAGFYAVQSKLSEYASEISSKVAEADSSNNSVEQLRRLESELERLADVRAKSQSIVAASQTYQNEIIMDLNIYAEQAGVKISQFSFGAGAAGSAGSSASAATPQAGEGAAAGGGGGSRTESVSITLSPPTNYRNLLKFIRSIENNLTKMQLAGITLSPGQSADTVSTNTLTIEVYVR